MNLLDETCAVVLQSFSYRIQCVSGEIDHGRTRNSVFRIDIAALVSGGRNGRHTRGKEASLPERQSVPARIRVGVEGINTIVLGGNVHDVVYFAADRKIRNVQGLCKDVTVHGLREQLAEARGINISGRQNRLSTIHACPLVVVHRRGQVHLRGRRDNGRQQDRRKRTNPPRGERSRCLPAICSFRFY